MLLGSMKNLTCTSRNPNLIFLSQILNISFKAEVLLNQKCSVFRNHFSDILLHVSKLQICLLCTSRISLVPSQLSESAIKKIKHEDASLVPIKF